MRRGGYGAGDKPASELSPRPEAAVRATVRAVEGSGRKVHENVTVTRDQTDGKLTVEWHDGPPQLGDLVLMSVELFQQMISQYNQNVSALHVDRTSRL